jgi:hypothetical protein
MKIGLSRKIGICSIDHNWHEFSGIEEKNDIPTTEQSIEELIERISYIVK